MQLAIAQLNPTIGDLTANVDHLLAAFDAAKAAGAELVVAPELAISGYPPRDLLDRPAFVRDNVAALARLAGQIAGPPFIVGAVVSHAGPPLAVDQRISNGAVVIQDGRIVACHRKMLLPTYDVFDEARYFTPGDMASVVEVCGVPVGLSVCEDVWNDKAYWETPRYKRDPLAEQAEAGAKLLINVSASPYDRGKPQERNAMLRAAARGHNLPLIYVNQVGGNDSIVFDGRSQVFDAQGELVALAPAFASTVQSVSLPGPKQGAGIPHEPWEKDVLAALCLGLADYVEKCGFSTVVVGLSGGIDSALTAAIAARALGPDRVIGVGMPSRYSSQGSLDDARELAARLGIRFDVVSIEPMFQAFLHALEQPFAGRAADVTEENLQARVRGTLLMAYSNKLGSLLLTTGNKSELAVGYSTLYGDMCGGLAVISDVYKTDVYGLANYLNATSTSPPIPTSSIEKAPSAELRPGQADTDSLPPYAELDAVLSGYIEEQLGVDALVARGIPAPLVRRVVRMVDRAEYKRRQMPPGIRVSRKAFGEGRRLPIAQRYS